MTRKTYSQEEKNAYFKSLRDKWSQAKEKVASVQDEFSKVLLLAGRQISPTGYSYIKAQIQENYPDYLPYVDVLTFEGWKAKGYKVKKGEKAIAHGITWIGAKSQEETENQESDSEAKASLYPKTYYVFGKHQVEPINS